MFKKIYMYIVCIHTYIYIHQFKFSTETILGGYINNKCNNDVKSIVFS